MKNPSRRGKGILRKLPFALTGGFGLFLALYAGLFIMLALTNFLKDAAAGALPLKPFDTNLGHCYPSPRSINALPAVGHTDVRQNHTYIIQRIIP